jgi:UDP:flavonoid glycosyltransferase YjiC (YdhE family)
LPRTWVGRTLWRRLDRLVQAGLRRGRAELNDARERLGLDPLERLHGGISAALAIVGTFPQLEYPRSWPENVHVVGPLMWEPPFGEVPLPTGEGPLVLVAPSTAQDPDQRLLTTAIAALAHMPVRVLATTNRKPLPHPVSVPPNTVLVDWLSYSRTMPRSFLVICHGGHGTVARALASGAPVVAVPHSGDMGENAARADWAGVGVRLPWRLLSQTTLRVAVSRALADDSISARARELATWASRNDGAARGAELVERLCAQSEA